MVNCNNIKILLFSLILISTLKAQQPAFPGAEGFGKFTSGGRAGNVLLVTNLNDNGPGSLRQAIESSGPRIIIFRISGIITLESPLVISEDDITIAGQTAPGDGICIRGFPTRIEANNVIIRYIRFRLGDINKIADDAINAIRQEDIIIDHCSMSWGIDEVATFYDNINTTVQWCIISESLNHSYHKKGDHGYGGIWGGMGATFHHNILAHHNSRNPRFEGNRNLKPWEQELVDFRNNVIYNWGHNSSYGGESGNYNIVANYYKAGPASKHKNRIVEVWDPHGLWYVKDNYVYGYPQISKDNWLGGVQGNSDPVVKANKPFKVEAIETQSALDAFKVTLSQAGAILPKRDTIDSRVVSEIRKGIAHFGGNFGKGLGIIDSQEEVGGWPLLKSLPAAQDSDNDGMPDFWEKTQGLDIFANDAGLDDNKDGYSNIENYINSISIDKHEGEK